MAKIIINGDNVRYYCPGCQHDHAVPAKRWNFNGNVDKPTLSPSVRHFIPAGEHGPEQTTCHYFVRNGVIQYCGDCQHDLAGKHVPMKDMDDGNDP